MGFQQALQAERAKHHSTVTSRVDSLQRTVDIFDKLVRKEISERSEEGKRVRQTLERLLRDAPGVQVDSEAAAIARSGVIDSNYAPSNYAPSNYAPSSVGSGVMVVATDPPQLVAPPSSWSMPSAPDRPVVASLIKKSVIVPGQAAQPVQNVTTVTTAPTP